MARYGRRRSSSDDFLTSARDRLGFRPDGGGIAARPAFAQADWPAKPVRIVVPFAPGGTTDSTARVVAEQLQGVFEQNFIVGGAEPVGGTPQNLARFIAAETAKWREVVKASGARID